MITRRKKMGALFVTPFAIGYGAGTVYLAKMLAGLSHSAIQFGTAELTWFAGYFLLLLSIPRTILYFRGATLKHWTFATYFVLPLFLFLLLPTWYEWGWLVVAAFAWAEVLLSYLPTPLDIK